MSKPGEKVYTTDKDNKRVAVVTDEFGEFYIMGDDGKVYRNKNNMVRRYQNQHYALKACQRLTF